MVIKSAQRLGFTLADLAIIRDTLRAALEAECDDLVACAAMSEHCPLQFGALAVPPGSTHGPR